MKVKWSDEVFDQFAMPNDVKQGAVLVYYFISISMVYLLN